MITDYQKFQLPDENKTNNIVCDVNWNTKDDKSNQAKLVRFTFPDGKQALVKRDYLNQILFAIGNAEDQKKLIPQTVETVHNYERVLGIKAEKDIRKGESINVKVYWSIPCTYIRDIVGTEAWEKEIKKTTSGIHKIIKS